MSRSVFAFSSSITPVMGNFSMAATSRGPLSSKYFFTNGLRSSTLSAGDSEYFLSKAISSLPKKTSSMPDFSLGGLPDFNGSGTTTMKRPSPPW